MEKRTAGLFLITVLFLISSVTAYSASGIFSGRNLLDSLDPSTIFLGGIFLIAFAILNMALSKVFKNNAGQPNTAVAGVVSFVLSIFIVYGLYISSFDIQGFFFGIGVASDTLYPIVAIILIAGSMFVIAKYDLSRFLAILGGFFIFASFFVYEAEAMLVLGILFEVLAFLLWAWRKKKTRNYEDWETVKGAGKWGAKKTWGGIKRTGRGIKKGHEKVKGYTKDAGKYLGTKYNEKPAKKAAARRAEDITQGMDAKRKNKKQINNQLRILYKQITNLENQAKQSQTYLQKNRAMLGGKEIQNIEYMIKEDLKESKKLREAYKKLRKQI